MACDQKCSQSSSAGAKASERQRSAPDLEVLITMSNFKIILTAIFTICLIVAIGLFALSKGFLPANSSNVVIWGTMPEKAFNAVLQNSSIYGSKSITVQYVQKQAASLNADFIESLAEGTGPDVIILRDDEIYKNRNKLYVIPYKTYSQRTFKDKFIEGGELFLTPDGITALPLIVDPMVMYWNRDMFSNALISQPPQYWDQIYSLVEKETVRDKTINILQSAIALGEWRNITNAKEILSMFFLQSGVSITGRGATGIVSTLNNPGQTQSIQPSQSVLDFYMQFSNPASPAYSWNRSLPSSFNLFLAGKLATYIGFASEIVSIQQKNPNLNFDVTYVPQVREASRKTVFAHMYAMTIVKQSRQIVDVLSTINALTESAPIKALEAQNNLPPIRRDLLADRPTDAFKTVFYNSALISKSWIDPDRERSSNTFRDMIESINDGKKKINQALSTANEELNNELK